MPIKLTIMSMDFENAEDPQTLYFDRDEITLGRLDGNDCVLAQAEVSGHHALLRLVDDTEAPELYVTDLGSSNGTRVESKEIPPEIETLLQPNERIVIGNFLIKPMIYDGAIPADYQPENGTSETNGFHFDEDEPQQIELGHNEEILEAEQTTIVERPEIGEEEIVDSEEEIEDLEEELEELSPVNETISQIASDTDDYIEVSASAVVGSDVVDLDFDAIALCRLSGIVTSNGSPLSGVSIDGGGLGTAESAEDGTFEFVDIEEGAEYSLTAAKEGYLIECEQAEGSIESDLELIFLAAQLGKIQGIISHKGSPLSGVMVSSEGIGEQTTDQSGHFEFSNLREGTDFRLSFSKKDFVFDPSELSGSVRADAAELEVSATQLFSISGTIRHKGKPLAGVEVDGGPLGKTTTGDDGVYTFEDVPEGTQYSIKVKKGGYNFASD